MIPLTLLIVGQFLEWCFRDRDWSLALWFCLLIIYSNFYFLAVWCLLNERTTWIFRGIFWVRRASQDFQGIYSALKEMQVRLPVSPEWFRMTQVTKMLISSRTRWVLQPFPLFPSKTLQCFLHGTHQISLQGALRRSEVSRDMSKFQREISFLLADPYATNSELSMESWKVLFDEGVWRVDAKGRKFVFDVPRPFCIILHHLPLRLDLNWYCL